MRENVKEVHAILTQSLNTLRIAYNNTRSPSTKKDMLAIANKIKEQLRILEGIK